jgi:poly(hydroxyalkanoate) depolymerase family esterase
MPSLGETFIALNARRRGDGRDHAPAKPSRLRPLIGFGANPGKLAAHVYVPEAMAPDAALVVVLHGCTQTAATYDHGSGWSRLADRHGFALLYPEQTRGNNPNLCFNWFEPGDVTRGIGEVASIHAMIEHMIDLHGLDRTRVFVTGLSAGGAMAASMLACYPETFAAGAIIAGLPHGVATNVPHAFEAMRGTRRPDPSTLQRQLTAASDHDGPWPRLSIWQGTSDSVVVPANAQALLAQWRDVHGAQPTADSTQTIDGATRRVWRDRQGQEAIELWLVPGMGHGTPIAPATDGLGQAMPHMLDHDVSSTAHIAAFFGLSGAAATAHQHLTVPATANTSGPSQPVDQTEAASGSQDPADTRPTTGAQRPAADMLAGVLDRALPGSTGLNGKVKQIIDAALRQAGLR